MRAAPAGARRRPRAAGVEPLLRLAPAGWWSATWRRLLEGVTLRSHGCGNAARRNDEMFQSDARVLFVCGLGGGQRGLARSVSTCSPLMEGPMTCLIQSDGGDGGRWCGLWRPLWRAGARDGRLWRHRRGNCACAGQAGRSRGSGVPHAARWCTRGCAAHPCRCWRLEGSGGGAASRPAFGLSGRGALRRRRGAAGCRGHRGEQRRHSSEGPQRGLRRGSL
mmetsp:Transcript_22308/g.68984  ORF Transcript_22308/g.68984 Transcript_22308/m.68984 type:complete len:221 (+) Transcript_22308:247-909(+)